MPTASDYEQGAVEFRRAAGELDTLAGSSAGSLPVSAMGQNPVRAALDLAVVACTTQLIEAADRYREHARTCDRRAETCRQLDAEWERWDAALAEHGSELYAQMIGGVQPPDNSGHPWYSRNTS